MHFPDFAHAPHASAICLLLGTPCKASSDRDVESEKSPAAGEAIETGSCELGSGGEDQVPPGTPPPPLVLTALRTHEHHGRTITVFEAPADKELKVHGGPARANADDLQAAIDLAWDGLPPELGKMEVELERRLATNRYFFGRFKEAFAALHISGTREDGTAVIRMIKGLTAGLIEHLHLLPRE